MISRLLEEIHMSDATKETIYQMAAGLLGFLSLICLPFALAGTLWAAFAGAGLTINIGVFLTFCTLAVLPFLLTFMIAVAIWCYRDPSLGKLQLLLLSPITWVVAVWLVSSVV